MSSNIVTLNTANFDELVLRSDKTVVVDFWAPWCPPCRVLGPTIDRLAEERPDLVVGKLNVDDAQEMADRYGITGIPTVLMFRAGELVEKSVGLVSFERLQELAPLAETTLARP
jgi:thioredoxin 1